MSAAAVSGWFGLARAETADGEEKDAVRKWAAIDGQLQRPHQQLATAPPVRATHRKCFFSGGDGSLARNSAFD